ncbi:hypothetical protein CF336_g7261 [Tilletia laevis]|nr:hypothetical protein CF336_g7261 [Tilletia laevis]KAE8188104.1 hypothetical protein CF328_g6715 [Tilletia controversa]
MTVGSQVQGWSRTLAISTYGLHVVVVPDREVPSWTRGGRNPLPAALASVLGKRTRVARTGTVVPSSAGTALSSLRRDVANAVGRLRRYSGRAWRVWNGR